MDLLDIQAATESRFTLKRISAMMTTYNQMHLTGTYLQQLQSLASLAKWLSVCYKVSGCRFEYHCCHLSFRYRASFEQGVP